MLENIDLAISTLKRLVIVNMYETKVKLKSYNILPILCIKAGSQYVASRHHARHVARVE